RGRVHLRPTLPSRGSLPRPCSSSFFSFHSSAHHRALPSFPTRRSSDLRAGSTQGRSSGRSPIRSMIIFMRLKVSGVASPRLQSRSEEHTSELQSRFDLVCRLLLEKKKKRQIISDYCIIL